MLTARAHWLLSAAVLACGAGVVLRQDGVALAGLALMLWIAVGWMSFQWKVLTTPEVFPRLGRTIDNSGRSSLVVALGARLAVRLSVLTAPRLSGLRLWIEDALPPGCRVDAGSPRLAADVRGGQRLDWACLIEPTVNGRLALPGLQVRIADPQGLFQQHRFVPWRQELTVLPLLMRPQSTASVVKQRNCQLFTGQHRHRQPGVSGELLSIRDYQPGDPPRTIAWKATARLGRLLTCEYESEVPIRATIVSDLSPYQFAGRPGPSRADKIVSVSASVARLLLADRDPVASVIVNQSHRARIPHSHGERQLTRILHLLLARLELQQAPEGIPPDELAEAAWTACLHRFPELLDQRVNPQTALFRFGAASRRRLRRGQLCFAIAEIQRRGPGAGQHLLHNPPALAEACRQLLSDYPSFATPAPVLRHDQHRRGQQEATGAICRALMEGVSRARDNELFVIAGMPPVDRSNFDRLEDALRVARANYHRVIMLSVSGQPSGLSCRDPLAAEILAAAERQESQAAAAELRRRLSRLGVRVAEIDGPALTEEIAAEVELLRFGRARATRRASPRTSRSRHVP